MEPRKEREGKRERGGGKEEEVEGERPRAVGREFLLQHLIAR